MEQTCKFCKSTWRISPSITKAMDMCPFCGKNLIEEMTIEGFLKSQIEKQGCKILENGSRINGMLADYFPKLERERSTMRKAFEYGAGNVFLAIANSKQCDETVILGFRKRLAEEAWLAEPAIDYICNTFAHAIGIEMPGVGITKDTLGSYVNEVTDNAKIQEISENEEIQSNLSMTSAEEYLDMAEHCEDDSMRAKYYNKAANLGNAVAMNRLGYMFEHGEGVSQNLPKAIELYKIAAQKGNRGAQHNLGFLYYTGNGVIKDLAKAFSLFQYAALQDNAGSQNNLGVMYEYGQGVKRDLQKAVQWYKRAADNGSEDGKANYTRLSKNCS